MSTKENIRLIARTPLAHYDETKKMACDSQIIRPKEYLKFSHVGLSQTQASGTNPPIKSLCQSRPDPQSCN